MKWRVDFYSFIKNYKREKFDTFSEVTNLRILFVAQNLEMGGIQKALINTLKELSRNNDFEIDLFIFGDGPLIEELPKNINLYFSSLLLNLVSTPFSIVREKRAFPFLVLRILCMILARITGSEKFYRLLFRRQRKFENYDVAISYFNDVQTGYFNRGTNQFVIENISAKKIAWIHTDPIQAGFKYKNSLNTYKDFDKIVCVSEACKKNFQDIVPEFNYKTYVVHNFFPIEEIKKKSSMFDPIEEKKICLVSVGRIDNSTKRFNYIPEICKRLNDASIVNYKWIVVGDGPDIESNKRLVETLKVSNFVEFVGEKVNPYPYIEKSDLFVLTSAYEGYPMVVGESIILGTPVLSTCYSAAHEQIVNNINGIITGMELEDLYLALKDVLENPYKLRFLKKNSENTICSNTQAMKQFLEVVK